MRNTLKQMTVRELLEWLEIEVVKQCRAKSERIIAASEKRAERIKTEIAWRVFVASEPTSAKTKTK